MELSIGGMDLSHDIDLGNGSSHLRVVGSEAESILIFGSARVSLHKPQLLTDSILLPKLHTRQRKQTSAISIFVLTEYLVPEPGRKAM